jgi:hypothetical protein
MPYTTSQSNGKVTVSKKEHGHTKVVGHTTPGKKNAYLAALHIHEPKKEGADVGQQFDNQVVDMYAVQKPYDGCAANKLVHKVDPLMGINGAGIDATEVYGAYLDEKAAIMMAEKLCNEFTKAAVMLEKKKQQVVDRLKEAIDQLEAKRSECVGMIKENPKESGAHKETIAQLATKIDDLMTKLEKIEKSKKEIKKDKEKKDLKEGLTKNNMKKQLNEVKRLQKIAGIKLNEDGIRDFAASLPKAGSNQAFVVATDEDNDFEIDDEIRAILKKHGADENNFQILAKANIASMAGEELKDLEKRGVLTIRSRINSIK